jgi:hypothetical protein
MSDNDLIRRGDVKQKCLEKSFYPVLVKHALREVPAVDAVPRGVFNQVQWERDVAIQQLAEYGVEFGEKKKDLMEVVHGYWVDNSFCSNCNWSDEDHEGHIIMSFTNYCPNCGAKMDLEGK